MRMRTLAAAFLLASLGVAADHEGVRRADHMDPTGRRTAMRQHGAGANVFADRSLQAAEPPWCQHAGQPGVAHRGDRRVIQLSAVFRRGRDPLEFRDDGPCRGNSIEASGIRACWCHLSLAIGTLID